MALRDMQTELRGIVPRIPFPYTRTIINRGWSDVRNASLWSFQLLESQWITPSVINVGTAAVTQGLTTVTLDATAAAALIADTQVWSPITSRQFRVLPGGVYNIVDWDGVNTLTLDRIYGETTNPSAPYLLYQVYYPAPVQDFKTFISVRNLVNVVDLNTTRTREEVDALDPQRISFSFPTDVIPYRYDLNSASPTYGFMLYELWPAPQYFINHQVISIRKGADLVQPTDTLPFSVSEDLVLARAKWYAYEWAESNKDPNSPRSALPDYKFLMGECLSTFSKLLKEYRRIDREVVDNFFTFPSRGLQKVYPQYSSLAGTAFPGSF